MPEAEAGLPSARIESWGGDRYVLVLAARRTPAALLAEIEEILDEAAEPIPSGLVYSPPKGWVLGVAGSRAAIGCAACDVWASEDPSPSLRIALGRRGYKVR